MRLIRSCPSSLSVSFAEPAEPDGCSAAVGRPTQPTIAEHPFDSNGPIGLNIGFSAKRLTNALAEIQNGDLRVVTGYFFLADTDLWAPWAIESLGTHATMNRAPEVAFVESEGQCAPELLRLDAEAGPRVMDYPWWTIDAADYGLREEDGIHCLDCAERNGKALGRELTDPEIAEAGGVSCQPCSRSWRPA